MREIKETIIPLIFTLTAIFVFLYILINSEKTIVGILGFLIAFIIQLIGFAINNIIFYKVASSQKREGEKDV